MLWIAAACSPELQHVAHASSSQCTTPLMCEHVASRADIFFEVGLLRQQSLTRYWHQSKRRKESILLPAVFKTRVHPPQKLSLADSSCSDEGERVNMFSKGQIQRGCVAACSNSRSSLSKYDIFPHTPVPLSRETLLSRSSTLVRHEHFRRVVKILFSRSLFERGFCLLDLSQL